MWQKFIAGQFVIWFWNLAWIWEIKFRYGDLLVIMTDIGMNFHRQGWFDGLLVGNHFGQQETEHDKYNPLDLKTSPHSGKVPRNTLLRKLNRFMWPGELIYIIDFTHENHSPLPGRVHRRQKLGAYLDAKLWTRKKKSKVFLPRCPYEPTSTLHRWCPMFGIQTLLVFINQGNDTWKSHGLVISSRFFPWCFKVLGLMIIHQPMTLIYSQYHYTLYTWKHL